jgi:hypothetical protein
MHIGNYIDMVHKGQQDLVKAFTKVSEHHGDEPDIKATCILLAGWSRMLTEKIKPFAEKYGEEKNNEPDRLMRDLFEGPRKGSMALLRDLQDLWLLAREAQLASIILEQAAFGLRDKELMTVCNDINGSAKRQISWLLTRMKSIATQTLIVAE